MQAYTLEYTNTQAGHGADAGLAGVTSIVMSHIEKFPTTGKIVLQSYIYSTNEDELSGSCTGTVSGTNISGN